MTSIETIKESNIMDEVIRETQKKVNEIKKEVEQQDSSGTITYLQESSDKKYYIFRYKLTEGLNRQGIIKKYKEQIGPRIIGTKLFDAAGNKIKKKEFNAGEIIYLRVPHIKNVKEGDYNRLTDPTNPANPASPFNPLHPLNPIFNPSNPVSPFNSTSPFKF